MDSIVSVKSLICIKTLDCNCVVTCKCYAETECVWMFMIGLGLCVFLSTMKKAIVSIESCM